MVFIWDLGKIFIILTRFIFKFSHLPSASLGQTTTVSFCDGEDLFLINDADCHGGLNFGERRPPCVCISGVYRSWTDDCGLYDGFTHQYCSSPWEDEDDSYNVQGLKLVPGIGNIFKDTAAVFGENGSDFRSWSVVGMGMNGKTWSDTFYVLNGFPVVLMKSNDKFICVEPSERNEKQVCRYFATDNVGLWEQGEAVRIMLMDNCQVKGYIMAELKEHRCYDIMDRNVSECQLSCRNGKVRYVPGSLPGREKKSLDGGAYGDGGGGDFDFGGDSMVEPSVGDPNGEQFPSQQYAGNSSFFLHRKLNKYIRLRQTGHVSHPDMSQVAPTKTFVLLDIARRIVRTWCPNNVVSDQFLDAALELFVVLHKGQDFRYIDDISQRDFQWIQEILLKCKKDVEAPGKYNGFETKDEESACKDNDYITKYTFVFEDIIVGLDLERGNYHQEGKYHFVIDAIWLIIDLTHTLCFQYFEKSYRMFHVWEQASEKLFTRDLRNLWFHPKVELTVYNALLSSRALVDMVNLDRCTEAAYKRWALPELSRPSPPKRIFKRRKRELSVSNERVSVAKSVDVFCAKKDEDLTYNC